MNLFFSVIIPVYDNELGLKRCLDSVQAQCDGDESFYEVIVVDNGADKPLPDIFKEKYPRVNFLQEHSKVGPGCARNKGAAYARGQWIAFIDSDCEPSVAWLSAAKRYIDQGADVDFFAGLVRLRYQSNQTPTVWGDYELVFLLNQERYIRHYDFAVTANLFIHRKCFESIGGFDEHLISGQDRDLCYRLRQKGHSIRFCEDAWAEHSIRSTSQEFFAVLRRHAIGSFLLMKKGTLQNSRIGAMRLIGESCRMIFCNRPQMSLWQKLKVLVLFVFRELLSRYYLIRLKRGARLQADKGFSRYDYTKVHFLNKLLK